MAYCDVLTASSLVHVFIQTATTNIFDVHPSGFRVLLRRMCVSDGGDCEVSGGLDINVAWKANVKPSDGTTLDENGRIVEQCFGP